MVHVNYSIRVALLAIMGLLTFAANAQAQTAPYLMDSQTYKPDDGFTAQGRVSETGYFDTNPILLTTPTKSLWGSITSPELFVNNISPTSKISSDTIFTSNIFNQSSFNSNDVHSKLNLDDRIQRWDFGLLGNIDYDTTRTSELSAYNNIHTTPVRHLGGSATPQITYNYLPTDRLSLAGNYTEADYSNSAFTDYNAYSLTPGYQHDFDERNTGLLSVTAQRYRALSGTENVTDTIGPSIGWRTIFTQRLSGAVSVGVEEVKQRTLTSPSPSWITQYTVGGNLNFKGDQDLTSLKVSRDQYPFGNGTEALLSQISLNEVHSINNMFAVGASASYQSADYQVKTAGDLDSLTAATLSLIYHITDKVDLTTSYQYEYETLVNVSSTAQKNVALISLSYTPQSWRLQ